jgi:hypothetical protein
MSRAIAAARRALARAHAERALAADDAARRQLAQERAALDALDYIPRSGWPTWRCASCSAMNFRERRSCITCAAPADARPDREDIAA